MRIHAQTHIILVVRAYCHKRRNTQELNGVLKDGQGSTFSVRSTVGESAGHQQRTISECDTDEMRKDTSVHESEKGPSLGMIQRRSKNDRNPNCCEEEARKAAWRWHKHVFKIHGTNEANEDTLFITKSDTRATSRTGISHEEREFTVDSGASMHLMSKSELYS